jgi:putative transcriptional regulator
MTRSPRTIARGRNAAEPDPRYMTGRLLIAMPGMRDIRFQKSVVYICAHSADGAMGLVVNKTLDSLTMPELMAHLKIPTSRDLQDGKIHFGGPVETARGFVLHSSDYVEDATMVIAEEFAMTATLDVLRAIGRGRGPRQALLALGYASWSPGQLDSEITANVWLQGMADETLVFAPDNDTKWDRAVAQIGIDARMLSIEAGHA